MIIGIGNVARVGKDTAAQALVRNLGFTRVAFADKLKELLFEVNPVVIPARQTVNTGIGRGRLQHYLSSCTGWEQAKDTLPEIVTLLENLGAGARKVFGKQFWVKAALDGLDPAKDYVISDVRYPDEVDEIRKLDGYVLRLDRPGHQPARRSDYVLSELDGWWDHVIKNDGDIQQLEGQIVEWVQALRASHVDSLSSTG